MAKVSFCWSSEATLNSRTPRRQGQKSPPARDSQPEEIRVNSKADPNAAISLYERIQQLHPQNPSAVAFNLGLVYRESGKVGPGNVQLRYAISLDPSLAAKVPAAYEPIAAATSVTGVS